MTHPSRLFQINIRQEVLEKTHLDGYHLVGTGTVSAGRKGQITLVEAEHWLHTFDWAKGPVVTCSYPNCVLPPHDDDDIKLVSRSTSTDVEPEPRRPTLARLFTKALRRGFVTRVFGYM